MVNIDVERRLAAILAADVAGYSRLVGADDAGTLVQWKAHWDGLIEPKAREHRGRIVRVLGDSILIEFGSVIDAMRCAIDVQRGMTERNTDVPLDRRIEFRMGINFGELIVEGGDFWGDGINIAARLEALAEPGGICISGRVHEDVYGKVDVSFEDAGDRRLKNIARSVRVYRVRFERPVIGSVPLALPDKPSIATLPFHVLSTDPEQNHFADGMVEEITTALSRIRQFFVIARNSTLIYKDRQVDVKQVSDQLGVRYVVQGTVRKASDRVRVTVQLVDAVTAHQIWAERYDREFTDIFALQDEITEKIVAALEPKLYGAEVNRTNRKLPESLDAWECVMRALSYVNNRSIHDYAAARDLLGRAIDIDPNYAQAHALLAYLTALEVLYGWASEERALPLAWGAAQKALLLDPEDAWVHLALGYVHQQCRRSEQAVQEYQNALLHNPNFALAHTYMAVALTFIGRIEEAFDHIAISERLSPQGLFFGVNNLMRAVAHFFAGEHREAIVFARKSVSESPGIVTGYRHLVVNCALVGELDEAKAALNILKRLQPEISLAWVEKWLPYRSANDRQKFIEGFRLAGLN